ncbi:acyltransferase family protein [Paraburkholderia ferrariae]|jgi:peptidoglycan/LPS O-acetylase OafA/YrhL|uniref:acyltransferase family protein n=1 Tax=Paraburkholderia ferrariae TaxID=386056 RepID=UPI0004872422|nr:acyltransferase [Paraburkholderia ferrariae]
MNNPAHSDKYATLDGLRGIAAVLVVMYHYSNLFSPFHVENAYLVVDLFFVMSGFVVASAYESKLASGSMGPRRFMQVRLIRLYPLYLLGTLLGVAGTLLRLPRTEWHLVATALPLALLMLPSPLRIANPDGQVPQLLYPLNFPSWSLFFELLANVAYGFCFRFLSTRVLLAVVATSGLMLAGKAVHSGSINSGWALASSHIGLVRVAYGFFFGVLLFRLRSARRRTGNAIPLGIAALFVAIFLVPIPEAMRAAYTLSVVLFAIPALVWVAASVEPSRRVRDVFLFFGTVSYGIYMLHVPVPALFRVTQGLSPHASLVHTLAFDAGLLASVVLAAALAEKIYDRPIRRLLLQGTGYRRRHAGIGAAPINQ